MAYVSIADRDHEIEHHDPQTFITKYVWSQDHKVIAIQYGGTAIVVGIVALCLSVMMRLQLGFPDSFELITPYVWFAGHGIPVYEHAQLLGIPFVRHHSAREFLRAGRRDRRGLDFISTAGDLTGNAGH